MLKKHLKKIVSLVLVTVMAIGMSVTAIAAEPSTNGIEKSVSVNGYTFSIMIGGSLCIFQEEHGVHLMKLTLLSYRRHLAVLIDSVDFAISITTSVFGCHLWRSLRRI